LLLAPKVRKSVM